MNANVISIVMTKEEFHRVLEKRMIEIKTEVKDLIELHNSQGYESLQKSYLWKVYHNLDDGVSWFEFFRNQKRD